MASRSLNSLSSQYRRQHGEVTLDELRQVASEFAAKRHQSVLDAAAIALAFDAIMSKDTFDVSEVTPEMAEAWSLAYPNVPLESLAGRSTEELAGAISGWKGKLFEVEVVERLNSGEWVGDLHLEPGQTAYIAESTTQPGWDIQIRDDEGNVADLIQLKATESISYIHEALARYPDTPILATSEVASQLGGNPMVLDSGISNDALTASTSDQVASASDSAVTDGLVGAMPLALIAITEASTVWSGKKTVDQALASGGDRVAKGVVAGAVAAGVSAIATPFVGAIAGFITRLALNENDRTTASKHTDSDVPRHTYLVERASQLQNSVATISAHYSPPQKQADRPLSPPPSISDNDELLSLVDPKTRLDILRSSMPLKDWIREMICKSVLTMTLDEVEQYLADVEMIKWRGLLDDAIPADGILGSLGRAMFSDHRDLKFGLDNAINRATIYRKSLSGGVTPDEHEDLMAMEARPLRPYSLGQAAASRERVKITVDRIAGRR